VSKVIKLAALFPKHLNLNGDHGNLLVLQKRLQWSGVKAEIVPVTSTESLSQFDFVLVGHGSKAAWVEVLRHDSTFVKNLVALIESGKTALLVASACDQISEALTGSQSEPTEHRSEFVKTEEGVVGYLNSDSSNKELQWHKNTLLTLLHGPVLAKNPALADELIHRIGIEVKRESKEFSKIDELAEVSRRIAFEN
jgi:CobQ-like glutamine amidotransferase family enzyme